MSSVSGMNSITMERRASRFDSLEQNCRAEIWAHCPEEGEEKVRQSIKELDRYVSGKRKFYPAEEIKEALSQIIFQQGYHYNHDSLFIPF